MLTRENLLDLIHSHGLEMKRLCEPSAHPYDDAARAKPYHARYQAARRAWAAIKRGENALTVLRNLKRQTSGIHYNTIALWEDALQGDLEETPNWFKAVPLGFHWVTYKGDFYGVDSGDELNLPRVYRFANNNLPPERRKLDGAREIAAMMPNPTTRVKMPIQVS